MATGVSMRHGKLTAWVARTLDQKFGSKGFDVLHDHRTMENDRPDKLGKIRSWFGSTYNVDSILADLDIAVICKANNKVYALVEIEETTDKPKVILGDILATIIGKHITFQGKRDLEIGNWTMLIVLSHCSQSSHLDRTRFLEGQSNKLKTSLTTHNASINKIIVDEFRDRAELQKKIEKHIADAIKVGTMRDIAPLDCGYFEEPNEHEQAK